jgi:hypothetical protein
VFSPSTASHVSFTDDLVTIGHKHLLNFRAIRYVKIVSPFLKSSHKGLNVWELWSPFIPF